MAYSFNATVAARGYHVYKSTTWVEAKVGDKVRVEIETDEESKKIDPYCCAIKASVDQQVKTVGHIPREISRHVYFFLKEENGSIDGSVKSIQYKPSPIPAGGLEIPLTLTFKSPRYVTHLKMKEFVSTLYSFEYDGKNGSDNESESDEEINICIQESDESSEASDSEVLRNPRKRKAPIITETSSDESDSEVIQKKKKKTAVIEETPESNAESNIDFLIDEEYEIEIEK